MTCMIRIEVIDPNGWHFAVSFDTEDLQKIDLKKILNNPAFKDAYSRIFNVANLILLSKLNPAPQAKPEQKPEEIKVQ